MKKDAYYFPHDSNAKDDPKCVFLIDRLGLEGYGIYWVLIETLHDQPDYSYPLALLPPLARRVNTSLGKVKPVVYNYGLFAVRDDTVFFSQALIDRMAPLEEKRQKRSFAGQLGNAARWGVAQRSHCDATVIAMRSQGEKIKPKHSKLKQALTVSADTLDQRLQKFHASLVPLPDTYGKELIREFYDYWSEPDHGRTRMRFELEKPGTLNAD